MADAPQTAPAPHVAPAADPLVADVLRGAMAAYLRADYLRAANLFLDLAAVLSGRREAAAWRFLGDAITNAVALGELVAVDMALVELEARR